MLIDFPNFALNNPWQVKTIQTSAPMPVKIVSSLEECDCFALHISWEHMLLQRCSTAEEASQVVSAMDDFLRRQARRSIIIWTLHNETSHTLPFKESEAQLRDVIMEHAAIIFLMSEKHLFKIPEIHHHKVKFNPHYIESSPLDSVPRFSEPTFFRYGAARDETNEGLYLDILNRSNINKFVSDKRLNGELNEPCQVVTKRRFTLHEADLYARFSNFSAFYRKPKFNSGVLNFMIGNKLVVFHDADTTKYMDLPACYEKFCIPMDRFDEDCLGDMVAHLNDNIEEIDEYIAARHPAIVSDRFWDAVASL